jgi:predicted ATP-grasp superfamily ATP-dependent carboligase
MPRILIIALSARPFATAAKQAGYQVTVIDGFGDAQTQACADEAFIVGFDETGFIADDLLDVINRLDTAQYQGFVYGSGFDGKPALLQEVANH